jgi:hypothetical protein
MTFEVNDQVRMTNDQLTSEQWGRREKWRRSISKVPIRAKSNRD